MPNSYGTLFPITVPALSDSANIITALSGMHYGAAGEDATDVELAAEEHGIAGHLQRLKNTKANYTDNLGVFADTTSEQLLSTLTDATGTGVAVFSTSPTLTTPTLGAATATTINQTIIPTNKTLVTTADTGTVTSTMILDGTIVNSDINTSAAIAYSKLALTGSVVNADINSSAAIAKTKIAGTAVTLADTGTVTSAMIADATIVNADISPSAAIAVTKIAPGTEGQVLNIVSGAPAWVNPDTIPTAEASQVANPVTFNSSGAGGASGQTYNGSTAATVSYNTLGAAPLSHTHGNISNSGAIGTTAGLMVKTTTSGALTTLAAGSTGQYLQHDGTWSIPTGTYSLPTATTSVLGGVKVDGTTITISSGVISAAPQYTLPTATTSVLGGVKVDGTTITISGGTISAAPQYTLPAATASVLGGIKLGSATAQTVAAVAVSSTDARTYASQVNASGQLVVNVPWTDTVYTLPTATASVLGGVKPDGTTILNSSGSISAPSGTYFASTGSATTSSPRGKVFVSPSAPTGAVAGDLWFW